MHPAKYCVAGNHELKILAGALSLLLYWRCCLGFVCLFLDGCHVSDAPNGSDDHQSSDCIIKNANGLLGLLSVRNFAAHHALNCTVRSRIVP